MSRLKSTAAYAPGAIRSATQQNKNREPARFIFGSSAKNSLARRHQQSTIRNGGHRTLLPASNPVTAR
jgi:hypothetical protein